MSVNLVSKWPTLIAAAFLCGMLGDSLLQAGEITPSDTGRTKAVQFPHVQVQIIPVDFKDGGRVARSVTNFYVAVWLRNTSDKSVTVPQPGANASDSVIQVLDPEGRTLLSPGWTIGPAGSRYLQIAPTSTKVFCVNAFSQECSFLPEGALKKGHHTVEFLGCKVAFEVMP